MNTAFSLRRWLIVALLCIAALPPFAVWVLHVASGTTTGPSAQTLAAARAYATGNVSRWTDPGWQAAARAYFAAEQVDAELRPASGPWFSTLAMSATAHVQPAGKFLVTEPGSPTIIAGSGWIIPHSTVRTGWTIPLAAGTIVLALTVAATGAFLGRHVVRPLTAITAAARTVPYGEADLRLPAARVGEVNAVAVALQTMSDPCREPVDLGALLRTAAQAHQPRADARHITLTVTTTAVPCTVSADEHLLTRVIGNLVDNALRHTPEHGQISLSCARADDEATFTVSDSGPGIDPADLPHLFTPLYRGEASRNRATGGAGLGLAIAQRILLAHGGTLTAANAAPHGASFTARVPVV